MIKVRRRAIVLASIAGLMAFAAVPVVHSETVVMPPTAEFATIDVRLMNETLAVLAAGSSDDRSRAIEQVKANPERYAPPVLYAMSQRLFQAGEKDEGAFWFYAGQLRARFDANLCLDASARSAVGVLNRQYGLSINQYMFANLEKLEALVPHVVEWDRKTPHAYDHRWINLHGMSAARSTLGDDKETEALSVPKESWPAIEERTRVEYLSGFNQALAQMKKK
ncbi:MAG TPA: hypothetical protein VGM81_24655 [Burkholderiaceae bacterium]|jgi:hypothetical protein